MHHLICYAVIASTGMDKYAGRVTELPASFVGEHRKESMSYEVGWEKYSERRRGRGSDILGSDYYGWLWDAERREWSVEDFGDVWRISGVRQDPEDVELT